MVNYYSHNYNKLKFLAILYGVLQALNLGIPFIFDEIEVKLHQNLVAYIIGLFQNKYENPHGAQLIFSFHNTYFDTYNKSRDYNILNSLKAKDNVEIYISKPCIENWLLAHFQKININESQCNRCLRNLKKYIARYEKNDCDMLTKFINEAQIKMAITNYQDLQGIPKVVKNNQLLKYQK